MVRTALAACLIALLPVVSAVAGSTGPSVDTVRTEQAEIREAVTANRPPYDKLSSDKRDELLQRQARMLRLLDGKQSLDQLNEGHRTDVINTLAWIESVGSEREDARLVCERRKILGSNRRERVCKTEAQWREEREAARNQLDGRGVCLDCRAN